MDAASISGLGRALVQSEHLLVQDAESIQRQAQASNISFVEQLVLSKKLTPLAIAKFASGMFGLPLLDLATISPDSLPKGVIDDELIAGKRLLPLFKRGSRLFVGTSDPTQSAAFHAITFKTGLTVDVVVVEDDKLAYCRELIEKAKTRGVKLILPLDVVVAAEMKAGTATEIVDADKMPADKIGLDVGPKTIKAIDEALKTARTVLWNGPLGVFEMEGFEKGTYALIETLIELTAGGARTIVGGGDSVSALKQKGVEDCKLTHVGTGGGASLEYLEGLPLPGIKCLDEKEAALSCS